MATSGIGVSLDDVIKQNKKSKKPIGPPNKKKLGVNSRAAGAKSKQTRRRNLGKAQTRAKNLTQQRGFRRGKFSSTNNIVSTQQKLKFTQQLLKAALSRNRIRPRGNQPMANRSAMLAAALGIKSKSIGRVRVASRGRGIARSRVSAVRGRRQNITINRPRLGVGRGEGRVGGRGGRGRPAPSGNIRSRLGWQGKRGGTPRRAAGPSTSSGMISIQRTKKTKGRGNVGGMQSDNLHQVNANRQRTLPRRGRAAGLALVSGSRQRRQQLVSGSRQRGQQLVSGSRQRGQQLVSGSRQRGQQLTSPNQRFAGGLFTRGGRRNGGRGNGGRGGRQSFRNNELAGVFRNESAGIFRNEASGLLRGGRGPPRRTAQNLPPVGGNMRQAFSRDATSVSLNERFGGGDRVRIKGGGRQIYL